MWGEKERMRTFYTSGKWCIHCVSTAKLREKGQFP